MGVGFRPWVRGRAPLPVSVLGVYSADFIRDSFTEASNTAIALHTPELGGVWTPFGNGVTVLAASGTAAMNSGAGDNGALNGSVPPSPNYRAEVQGGTVNATANTPQVYVRATQSAGTIQNCYFIYYGTTASVAYLNLCKKVGTTFTSLANTAISITSADTVGISAYGTTIQSWVNGVAINTVIDGSVTAAGSAGFAGGVGASVDNFRAFT